MLLPIILITVTCLLSSCVYMDNQKSKDLKRNQYEVFGKVYETMSSSDGYLEIGVASWYGPNFHGKLTANGEIYEGIVYFVDGYDEAYVILPQETWQWTGPITVTLLPFTGSSLATLTIPDNAGRYWWAVTPTNVLAIDLELSQWTAQGTTAGDAVFAHVHQAPVDWLPANTPNNATSVAYDSVDDRLWVMVAFSSVNDDDQILWRIEDVSSATPTFVQHANFGIVAEKTFSFLLVLKGVITSYPGFPLSFKLYK